MQDLMNFILNGSSEFTPEVMIRFMVFVMILSAISGMISAIGKGVK